MSVPAMWVCSIEANTLIPPPGKPEDLKPGWQGKDVEITMTTRINEKKMFYTIE